MKLPEFIAKIRQYSSAVILQNKNIVNLFWLFFCLLLVALNSSVGRPIWIDEFLHFTLGSHYSTSEAWDSINKSIVGDESHIGVNHGQTGIYMLVDYWLMQLFGANSFWLRFPSIFSGLILFLGSLYLLRLWRMPFIWQVIGILGLFTQNNLMYFIGEARPYIILSMATICTLAYYSTPLIEKELPKYTLFGLFSILAGVLFHPYFSVYWLAIIVFTYVQKNIKNDERRSIVSVIKHINLPISITGIVVYFTLGFLTWLRKKSIFSFDPFQWIKNDGLIKTFFEISHFQFLQGFFYPLFIITMIIILVIIVFPKLRKMYLKELISPTILLITALSISMFLSYISFKSNYWILPRQWVASMSISVLAFTWLSYTISRFFSKIHMVFALLWMTLCFTPILINSYNIASSSYNALIQRLDNITVTSQKSLISSDSLKMPTDSNEWVDLANKNIQQGGKVWPIFRRFYI